MRSCHNLEEPLDLVISSVLAISKNLNVFVKPSVNKCYGFNARNFCQPEDSFEDLLPLPISDVLAILELF